MGSGQEEGKGLSGREVANIKIKILKNGARKRIFIQRKEKGGEILRRERGHWWGTRRKFSTSDIF